VRPWLTISLLALNLGACSCESDTDTPGGEARVYAVVDGALLAKSWPVRMADNETRARFESHAGWRAVFEQDLVAALTAFAQSEDPRGLARVHQGLADLYRQAALLAANASVEAFSVDAAETDPLELAYVVGVSRAVRGEFEVATRLLSEAAGGLEFGGRAAAWSVALAQEPSLPDLSTLMGIAGDLGEVQPGTDPSLLPIPDAELPERSEQGRLMGIVDPTRFLARAAWHEAAAAESAPQTDAGVLDQIGARYETAVSVETTHLELPLDDAWLFAAPDLVASDVSFIAEAKFSGLAAVTSWADRSVLAAALAPAIVEGSLQPQLVLDAGLAIQVQIQAMMADVSGQKMDFHRPFAQRARIAVLMAGMVVADANDQYRDAGILRLNSLERMDEIGVDPVFAVSVAAWDAGNRSPMRPEEIVHQLKSSYPALAATRAPLEALHLRRSRNAGPSNPVH
jgi:hypothetical protein